MFTETCRGRTLRSPAKRPRQTFGNFHGSGLGGWLVLRHDVADGTYSGERTTYALDEEQ